MYNARLSRSLTVSELTSKFFRTENEVCDVLSCNLWMFKLYFYHFIFLTGSSDFHPGIYVNTKGGRKYEEGHSSSVACTFQNLTTEHMRYCPRGAEVALMGGTNYWCRYNIMETDMTYCSSKSNISCICHYFPEMKTHLINAQFRFERAKHGNISIACLAYCVERYNLAYRYSPLVSN